jgi:4-aminobutyrate aminotransferase-like enzyme/Ser/Thr protein kinase RdoA (MazF antagonist)
MIPEMRAAQPITASEAERLARQIYQLETAAKALPGEYDHNFHLSAPDGREFVLKVMHPARDAAFVDMQCRALQHLAQRAPDLVLPRICPTASGQPFTRTVLSDGTDRLVWMLTFIHGIVLAEIHPRGPGLLRSLGKFLGEMDSALADFSHPAAQRELKWDLSRAAWIRGFLHYIKDSSRRALVEQFLLLYESQVAPLLPTLRRSVIYGDANDYNVLIRDPSALRDGTISVIDFGDMHFGVTVSEVAIAAAYSLLGEQDPLQTATHVVSGYHSVFPLQDAEIRLLHPCIAMRLAVSVTNSAHRKSLIPDDPYITISETPAWEALEKLAQIDPELAHATFRNACGFLAPSHQKGHGVLANSDDAAGRSALPENERHVGAAPSLPRSAEETFAARRSLLGLNLSVSYQKPLKIVRGWMQYLYDDTGRRYLDVYNNVPLVGHSHPRVVRAVQEQIAILNTNTRYLHDNILCYAERLTALLPQPLRVCYFVNSGSEANELALRLARAHTKREDVIVLEHAYHGHTNTLIDISPYKFNGPGGGGQKPWVHVAPIPDDYRGPYRRGDPDAGPKYAQHVAEIIDSARASGRSIAAFIAETMPSVAGQIVFPPGYLEAAYRHVRAAGGVCIADEVQVGFGRLGTHFWGFETQNVVPDIVVFGKPIGNAFPLAAVVTTREIAASFANGMEFFSTFGGNPVACAAGLAVLDVLQQELLHQNALHLGNYLIEEVKQLQKKHALIGDVRGSGLFLGVDLVQDWETREPAPAQASYIVNRLRENGVLTGTDGPHHNVLKLRPPLIFSTADADFFAATLGQILTEEQAQPQKG